MLEEMRKRRFLAVPFYVQEVKAGFNFSSRWTLVDRQDWKNCTAASWLKVPGGPG
jgi:hypothetical protein